MVPKLPPDATSPLRMCQDYTSLGAGNGGAVGLKLVTNRNIVNLFDIYFG